MIGFYLSLACWTASVFYLGTVVGSLREQRKNDRRWAALRRWEDMRWEDG